MKIKLLVFVGILGSLWLAGPAWAAEEPGAQPTQYLYIEEFTVPAGRAINDAIDEGKQWVKAMRQSGDFKSVRLYFHHTGPKPAVYILAEPKSWASIESGIDAQIEATDAMNKPFQWGGHSDNLLSEVPVD